MRGILGIGPESPMLSEKRGQGRGLDVASGCRRGPRTASILERPYLALSQSSDQPDASSGETSRQQQG